MRDLTTFMNLQTSSDKESEIKPKPVSNLSPLQLITFALMEYSSVESEIILALQNICGSDNVFFDSNNLDNYSYDETEDLKFPPAVVVKPRTSEEISNILKLANEKRIPVTPRGAGTGLSGGALPVFGGILLSTERMNEIIFIDEKNHQVTTEPGVITEVLQNGVAAKNLYYPPDPASKGSSFIGGNVAENSGGPHAVKYGVVKDYVLNLEMVLPTGEIIWTGANVLKNSTGYNLTQLIVGSEGTLGIVTKIVLRLIPLPKLDVLMLFPFLKMEEACHAVNEIFLAGVTPSAIEFMERDAIDWVMKFSGDFNLPVEENIEAHLLIELDGNDAGQLQRESEKLFSVLGQFRTGEVLFAETEAEKNRLWKMRRSVAEAVKVNSVYKEEDTVVPRAALTDLLTGVKKICTTFGIQSVCYGHAGDGNLHVNLIKGNLSTDQWEKEVPVAIKKIFELVVSLGGTLSGEHGIGWVQKNFMPLAFTNVQLDLFRKIKSAFDPNQILNPGKIFPDK